MKYIKYILVLIILIGLFSPMVEVSAQTPPLGNCSWPSRVVKNSRGANQTIPGSSMQMTHDDCDKHVPPGKWTANDTSDPIINCTYTTKGQKGETITSTRSITTSQCNGYHAAEGQSTTAPVNTNTKYQLLAPLPCDSNKDGPGCTTKGLETFDTSKKGLGSYLNLMIKLFIGLCAVLSVVMIVMGGLQYMTSELPGNKEAGKKKIIDAIFGLLLALGAYALLFTINPDLLKIPDATVPAAQVTAGATPAPGAPTTPGGTPIIVENWYFRPRTPSGTSAITGPFSTQEACLQRQNADGYSIVTPCTNTQSGTIP